MTTTPPAYRRLTRAKSRLGGYTHLWLGPDHLLLVESTGWTENYRRFYFRDLQGFYLQPNWRMLSRALVFGGLAAFVGLLVQLASGSAVATTIVMGILLVPFIWNLALGPGCWVYAVTAVQVTRLDSITRVRKARRVVARVQPLVVAAQSELVPPLVAPGTPPGERPPAEAPL